ncbi:unnamed protein product [Schistosoma mattheei]|uniref:Uncharacterized protein n=1 Tax=Schistosoma mattheei TaxID=31246 RepID=A0A183NGD5_9TREM|nr:unnamed protein product [Schistosoma mattheei]
MESIDVLKKNLELAKEQLKIVDNDIKRITGRDPSDRRIGEANSKRIRARIAGVNQLRVPCGLTSTNEAPCNLGKQFGIDLKYLYGGLILKTADKACSFG